MDNIDDLEFHVYHRPWRPFRDSFIPSPEGVWIACSIPGNVIGQGKTADEAIKMSAMRALNRRARDKR